ncbi:hypothetical protein [Bradyrhizobium elkanii]|uniref:hypothetical protein n=1 Tax=Bradyrhizobium elkanii TaxID=29448 RepID=UPI003518678D
MRKSVDLEIGGAASGSSVSRDRAVLQRAIANILRGLELTMATAVRYSGLEPAQVEAILNGRSDLDEVSLAAALKQMSKSIV